MAEDMGFDEVLHKADQTLRQELPLLPADFAFRWAGIDFTAQLERRNAPSSANSKGKGENSYRLTLQCTLGHMPYSAEDGEARRKLRAILATPLRKLGARFQVTRQGAVVMTAVTDFPEPLNADGLMLALTLTLLHIRPALTRLRSLLLRGNGVPIRELQGAGVS